LGDLNYRLKASSLKLLDFQQRIKKRYILLKNINFELKKQQLISLNLKSKDKQLRTRLIRNTEMVTALRNLADIAGYKLNSTSDHIKYDPIYLNSIDENYNSTKNNLNDDQTNMPDIHKMNAIAKKLLKDEKHNTFKKYIRLTYGEVSRILMFDKQNLVSIVRQIKTNAFKLKQLLNLKIKVTKSLNRLTIVESKLKEIINNDLQIKASMEELEQAEAMNTNKIN
jgi:hypothetical protein